MSQLTSSNHQIHGEIDFYSIDQNTKAGQIYVTTNGGIVLKNRVGTDQNLCVQPHILQSDGVSFTSVNDANTANLGMEFRGTGIQFTSFATGLSTTSKRWTFHDGTNVVAMMTGSLTTITMPIGSATFGINKITASQITGALSGTASNAKTASFAITSSYALTSSYTLTSSLALSASYVSLPSNIPPIIYANVTSSSLTGLSSSPLSFIVPLTTVPNNGMYQIKVSLLGLFSSLTWSEPTYYSFIHTDSIITSSYNWSTIQGAMDVETLDVFSSNANFPINIIVPPPWQNMTIFESSHVFQALANTPVSYSFVTLNPPTDSDSNIFALTSSVVLEQLMKW
jgi:hypothetical protein